MFSRCLQAFIWHIRRASNLSHCQTSLYARAGHGVHHNYSTACTSCLAGLRVVDPQWQQLALQQHQQLPNYTEAGAQHQQPAAAAGQLWQLSHAQQSPGSSSFPAGPCGSQLLTSAQAPTRISCVAQQLATSSSRGWHSTSGSKELGGTGFQHQAQRTAVLQLSICQHSSTISWHLLPNSTISNVRRYAAAADSSSSSSSSSGRPPKNMKGSLPHSGPSHKALRALPFTVSRAAAAEAFAAYHGRHWYQSRQRPVLLKPFKETFLPFWVGSGTVRVEVSGAEVGHEHLVTRYNAARRRDEPRWETVWSRVKLHLVWDRQLRPEEPEAQLYASWKYPRSDVDVLRPGPLVTLARPITPDMLQASAGAGTDTRRVGPFTVDPLAARKLLMSQIEATERQRAEQEIARLTGAQQIRFIDMHCTYLGSTGAARGGGAAAAAAGGGLDLSPVYVPAYIFSWWHGGAKVRTFVSAVNPSAVSGVQVLDDTKLATYATLATAGAGLFLGVSANTLLWGALVVPFVAVGLVSRFWPLLRSTFVSWKERLQQRWKETVGGSDYCEVNWNAAFVHVYEAQETRRRQQEQRQSYWQDHGHGPFGGAAQDPREFFQQFTRDPFSWFEQQFAKQQQQQQSSQQSSQRQQGYQGYEQQHRQQQQQQQQQQYGGSRATSGSPGDPMGYYNTLGVKPGCSTQEIQAAFRGLALKHHPDRYSSAADKEKATKTFQTITEAYQVLRDQKKRQQYDTGHYHDRA